MTGYIARRLLWLIPILLAITVITFALMHTVKGGPFEQGDSKSSSAARQALNAKYHLDKPVYVQYFHYMKNLVQGDLGPDLVNQGTSVNDIFKANWKPTVVLGLLSAGYVLIVGMGLGILAAIRKNSILDYLSVGFATIGASTPNFVLGILLVTVFAVELGWLPAIGWSTGWTDWKPVILPTIVLGSLPAAYIARITRASMLEVMSQDYVRTARAKGLREQVIIFRHIVRNAMIPVLTLIGPITATLVTGSFVVEFFFAIPGIGRSYVQAIIGRDYPLIMATTLLYAVVIAIANLVVDVLYGVVDPRIKYS
jgi:oligopeptide transport system permease protein